MPSETPSVVIIGAGAAGLSSVRQLVDLGFPAKSLVILEGQDRIGGRIHTILHDEVPLEMGAQWVHGQDGNIVHEMAAAAELNTDIHTLQGSGLAEDVVFSLAGKELTKEQQQYLFAIYEHVIECSKQELPSWNGSFGEYFTQCFRKRLLECPSPEMDSRTAESFLAWAQLMQNIIDGSDDWMETSGPGHVHYRECAGDPLVTWKRGYKSLFNLLLPDGNAGQEVKERILFNKVVTKISWDKDDTIQPILVECSDGSSFPCDYVLVTCSLGFLKKNCNQLFAPSLPEEKQKTIEALGFGTVDKIYLKFKEPWWTSDWGGVNILHSQDDLNTAAEMADASIGTTHSAGLAVTPSPAAGATSQVESESQADVEDALRENWRQSDRDNRNQNHRVWTDYILGFHTVRNHPNLLVGWISGAAARHCESLDADQVLRSCSSVLKRHVNADWPYTEPVAVLRSTWYTNPFFCGSYSYRSQETERHFGSGAHILAAPVSDSSGRARLFFAGEATHDHFYSTVHGAVETGFRAAQQIVDQWRTYGRHLAKL